MAEPVGTRWNRAVLLPVAVGIPLLVCAVLSLWREQVPTATAVLLLVALVVAAAATGDRLAGVTAALSSAVWFDFFLTSPRLRFTMSDPDEIEATVLLVLIGAAVTELALWGRRQQAGASRRAGYLDGVLGTAELMLVRHDSVETLIHRVADQITEVLGIGACRYVEGPYLDREEAVLHHDGSVTRLGHLLDVDRDGLPTDIETALLVRRDEEVTGRFELVAADQLARPTLEQRRVAVLLADQVAGLLGDRPR